MSDPSIEYGPLTGTQRTFLAESRTRLEAMRVRLGSEGHPPADASPVALVQAILDRALVGRADIPMQEAMGVVLGDELARRLGLSWECVTDAWGETAAVVHPSARAQAYAIDWIAKRFENDDLHFDVASWFDRMVEAVRESASAAGPR